jgi:hypothetical protein
MKLRMVALLSVATLLPACETAPSVPGAAQVRVTRNPADVSSCTAVGNVDAGCSPEGQQRTFEQTIRERTIGVGGNTVLVTTEWQGMVCGGIAYACH